MDLISKEILIVDDDFICLEMAKDILESQGASIYSAKNGKEAIDKIGQQKLDLIIIDYEMPVMNGIEFLKYRKSHTDIFEIPVLLLTGSCNEVLENEARDYGVTDILKKPYSKEELLGMLELYLYVN